MDKSKPSQEENRTAYRDKVQIMVDVFYGDGKVITLAASDLSRTGAFLERGDIESAALPVQGSQVQLTIRWPIETAAPAVKVPADVVRTTDNGIGVQFIL